MRQRFWRNKLDIFIRRSALGIISIAIMLLAVGAEGGTNAFFDGLTAIAPMVRDYQPQRHLSVYLPSNPAPAGEKRAAMVFIHGGGWGAGKPELYAVHCRYYAARGLVAVTVQYRLTGTNTTVFDCISDVKSALRWLRVHAAEFNVDPNRIAAFGDSAGGHLAACAGIIAGLEAQGEELKVSSRPDALVLLYPITDTTPPDGWEVVRFGGKAGAAVAGRLAEFSPVDQVTSGAPPTLILHGTADKVVPYAMSERFAEAMRKAGNTVERVPVEGRDHAFITPGYGDDETISNALARVDAFLAGHGFFTELTRK